MHTNKRFVWSFTLPPLRVASRLSFDIPFGSCLDTCSRDRLMFRDQLRVVQGDKGLVYFYDRNDQLGGSMGIRGSILYVYKKNECIVPTLVLFQSISVPQDEIERERVGACVIPKAYSKFWTGDHSIRKSYIKGIQCSFRFWMYNILPPILSSLHRSFMCSQSISTLIKLTEKSINIQQRPINIVRFVRTPRFVFRQRWFPICFQPRECACSRACSSY